MKYLSKFESFSESTYENVKPFLNAVSVDHLSPLITGEKPTLHGTKKLFDGTQWQNIKPDEFIENVEKYLDTGGDINEYSGYLIRVAAMNYTNTNDDGWSKVLIYLVDKGISIERRRYIIIKWALEWGAIKVLKTLLPIIKDLGVANGRLRPGSTLKEDWISWTEKSDKIDETKKLEVKKVINEILG